MPYLGHSPTNAGTFIEIDDFSSTFNGAGDGGTDVVAFTLQVGGVDITPNTANVLVMLDGILQQPPSAYSISGSTLTFTEAPASGTDLYAILIGQSASVGQGSITASELAIAGNGTNNQLLKSDGDGTMSWINQNTVTASTAATLATARTIGGTSFDGSANIAVALAATATTLATTRAINGVNFDGSAAITVTADANTLSNTTLKSTVVASSLTSVGTLTALTVDDITINGSTISDSGDFTLDVGGTIILDGDTAGDNIHLKDSGIHYGSIVRNNSDLEIRVVPQDEDIVFKGNDGGSSVTALTLDMSAGGAAFFSGDISCGTNGDLNTRNATLKSDSGTLNFYNAAGTQRAFLALSGTGLIIDTDSFLEFKPNNTRALYIDSSLNSTFAGNITLANNKYLNIDDSGGTTKNIIGLSSGNVVEIAGSNNAVTFGTGTATFAGQVTATGIKFDASGEVLDDYEEGTWTPNVGSGITVSGTASSTGTYTKIGNMVTIHCSITVSAGGSLTVNSSLNVIVGVLPFTIGNSRSLSFLLLNSAFTQAEQQGAWSDNTYAGTAMSATTSLYFAFTYASDE